MLTFPTYVNFFLFIESSRPTTNTVKGLRDSPTEGAFTFFLWMPNQSSQSRTQKELYLPVLLFMSKTLKCVEEAESDPISSLTLKTQSNKLF